MNTPIPELTKSVAQRDERADCGTADSVARRTIDAAIYAARIPVIVAQLRTMRATAP